MTIYRPTASEYRTVKSNNSVIAFRIAGRNYKIKAETIAIPDNKSVQYDRKASYAK
jgi:hypothetical protein